MKLCQICNNIVAETDTACQICGGRQFTQEYSFPADAATDGHVANKPFPWLAGVTILFILLLLCGLPIWLPALLNEAREGMKPAHVLKEKGETADEIMAKEGQPLSINVVRNENKVTLEYEYPDHTYILKRGKKDGKECYRVIDAR
jgi:hypothetical protein